MGIKIIQPKFKVGDVIRWPKLNDSPETIGKVVEVGAYCAFLEHSDCYRFEWYVNPMYVTDGGTGRASDVQPIENTDERCELAPNAEALFGTKV